MTLQWFIQHYLYFHLGVGLCFLSLEKDKYVAGALSPRVFAFFLGSHIIGWPVWLAAGLVDTLIDASRGVRHRLSKAKTPTEEIEAPMPLAAHKPTFEEIMPVVRFIKDAMQETLLEMGDPDITYGICVERGSDLTCSVYLVHEKVLEDNVDHLAQASLTLGNNRIKAWHRERGELYQETPAQTLMNWGVSDIVFANWMPIAACPPTDPEKDWNFRRYKVGPNPNDTSGAVLELFRDSRIHDYWMDPTLSPKIGPSTGTVSATS